MDKHLGLRVAEICWNLGENYGGISEETYKEDLRIIGENKSMEDFREESKTEYKSPDKLLDKFLEIFMVLFGMIKIYLRTVLTMSSQEHQLIVKWPCRLMNVVPSST